MTTSRAFDPIGMEVFSNRLLSITEDMAITMMHASFSPQIKERRDFSVGLFDGRGRLIAQGAHIPLHLGSLIGSIAAIREAYPPETMVPGDAFMCNDPYLTGGTHLPDISVISPVFHGGVLVAFAGNIGHHSDVGGGVPGSTSALSRSIFEEGIRIPAIRIAAAGVIDGGVLNLVAQNSRLPEERRLDLEVQVAINQRGAAAVCEMIDRAGLPDVLAGIDDIITYTGERLRRRILSLPPGRYDFTNWLDDDGLGGDPVPVVVSVQVEGDRLVFDLEGTGPQGRGALNVPKIALSATIYYCVKALLDPDLMPNQGLIDGIEIRAPEGCIVNPRHPAAVGARSITCQKVAGAVFGALRGVLPPERRIASGNDILPSLLLSGTRAENGQIYVWGETVGGGSGARFDSDGMDAIHVHVTNTLNMPTEALENEFPLMCDEYALVQDSGGAGTHRGGLGIARQVRALHDGTSMNCRSDSHKFGALGIDGGLEGGKGRLIRNYGRADTEEFASKVAGIVLKAGETVRLHTPGGGGFGPPSERSVQELAADLRDGVVTQAAARADYGTALTDHAIEVLRR